MMKPNSGVQKQNGERFKTMSLEIVPAAQWCSAEGIFVRATVIQI